MSESVRDVVVRALLYKDSTPTEYLDHAVTKNRIDPKDIPLARQLTLGCVRRRETLDVILRAFMNKPQKNFPAPVHHILQVGLYQILFLDRVPDFAAVNEAVEQTTEFGHKRQQGFVNALLRTIVRGVGDIEQGKIPLEPNVLPVAWETYRRFEKPVFADPKSEPIEYLSQVGSLPPVLAGRWFENFGSLGQASVPAFQANCTPPLIVRVNKLKADVNQAIASMTDDGADVSRHKNGHSIVIRRAPRLANLRAFIDGWIQPQDPTATAVSIATGAKSKMRVLDLCAAPGTKTTHLAELMGNEGSITAVDVPARLQLIESNARRMGITIIETVEAEKVSQLDPESFDIVLADVPCSNTGVLARRAEARWKFDERNLQKLAEDQRFFLSAAERFVKNSGRVVYSTCSLEPEENQRVVERFAGRKTKLKLASSKLTVPNSAGDSDQWCDGGFIAVFQAQ